MAHRRENVGTVGSSSLDAVTMVNASISGLLVHIKVAKAVVEVDGASTQISPQQSCVSCKDCRNINSTTLA